MLPSQPSHISWIIHSGATNHMSGNPSFFSSYSLCSGQDKVMMTNGTHATIAGERTVKLNNHLSLPSTLHVPSLPNTLLFVNNLTESSICSITFFLDHCVLQDLKTERTIGSGTEEMRLYLLHDRESTTLQLRSTRGEMSQIKEIHMRHCHLGLYYLHCFSLFF